MIFKTITIQNQSFIVPTWEEMGELCFELSKKIIESGKEFDRIIALAKGGWTWARAVSDYTKIQNVGSIQYEFYADIYKTNKTPKLKQPLPISVKGEKLLVLDDVADSGATLHVAVDYLQKSKARTISTATFFYKPWSTITPDFFVYTTDTWVIHPHEIREMVELLSNKWKKDGSTKEEIRNYFTLLKLPANQVTYFIRS